MVRGGEVKTFKGHTGRVNSGTFSHDGKYIASGSSNDTVKVWDVVRGKEVKSFYIGRIGCHLSFSPDDSSLMGDIGRFEIGHVGSVNSRSQGVEDENAVSELKESCCLRKDGTWVTTAGPEGRNLLWLPPDYRSRIWKAFLLSSKCTVAIGCPSGRMVIMGFLKDFSLE